MFTCQTLWAWISASVTEWHKQTKQYECYCHAKLVTSESVREKAAVKGFTSVGRRPCRLLSQILKCEHSGKWKKQSEKQQTWQKQQHHSWLWHFGTNSILRINCFKTDYSVKPLVCSVTSPHPPPPQFRVIPSFLSSGVVLRSFRLDSTPFDFSFFTLQLCLSVCLSAQCLSLCLSPLNLSVLSLPVLCLSVSLCLSVCLSVSPQSLITLT